MSHGVSAPVDYEAVIGLEVHTELLTQSKLFCSCANRFGAPPNTLTCPVCLALPGSLPVLNRKAVELLVRAALALNCQIPAFSKFDRKNYFYPDMPKNFQISQYDLPLSVDGYLDCTVDDRTTRVRIKRIHLEEDTGKSTHLRTGEGGASVGRIGGSELTVEDYNRAGVPLAEIVSEPDIRSPQEAYAYLVALREILTWVRVSDCKMEEGSLRCDANVSVRPRGSDVLGTKVEVKNMNSFKSVQRAVAHEIERQTELLRGGGTIVQETRAWDEERQVTHSLRSKEAAHDYRYFPEPDLLPMDIDAAWVESLRRSLPELPSARRDRLVSQYGIPPYDATVLTSEAGFADYFEQVCARFGNAKEISNWLMGDFRRLDAEHPTSTPSPENLARMLTLIDEGVISKKIGKQVLEEMFRTGQAPDEVVESRGWKQVSSAEALKPIIEAVLSDHADKVADYLAGKEKLFGFLVGQVMSRTQGKAAPGDVNRLLKEILAQRR